MNWINHVKEYSKLHNVPYNQALKEAKTTYGGKLVKNEDQEKYWNSLYKVGTTIKVPKQLGYINEKGQKDVIDTITPKTKKIAMRKGKSVLNFEENTINEFKIINSTIYDSYNRPVVLEPTITKQIITEPDIDSDNEDEKPNKLVLNNKYNTRSKKK